MGNFVKLVLLWLLISAPVVGLFGAAGYLATETELPVIGGPIGDLMGNLMGLELTYGGINLDLLKLSLITGFSLSLLIFLLFYYLSDRLLLRWYKAERIQDDGVIGLVKELAEKAEIPVPEVFVAKIEMPNAFALGRNPKKGKIIISKPLMSLLDQDELKAVIAHEIVHIKNRDTLISGPVAVLAGILISLSTLAFWASLLTGFGQEDDPAPNLIRLFVLSLVAPVAALLVYIFISSSREYLVDEESVKLLGDSDKAISSLEKLNRELKSKVYEVNVGHAHLFTVNPLHRDTVNILDFTLPTYASLFNTNPSIVNRLKMLKGEDGVGKVKARILARPLFYTFMSNMLVLFAIIVVDTFNRKDFDFGRASIISAAYVAVLTVFLLLFLTVFFLRRG